MSAADPMDAQDPCVAPTATAYRRDGCEECGQPHPKCTAHRSEGTPCMGQPMTGTTVCRKHGGKAPQVVAKAKLRILGAQDKAAGKMIGLLDSKDEAMVFKASADLLDRGGLGAKKGIEVSGPDGEPIPVEVRVAMLVEAARNHLAGVGKGTEE